MNFLIPKYTDLVIDSTKTRITGWYNVKVCRGDGTVRQELDFPNLFLDTGLNQWGTTSRIASCAVGTGTSTPSAGQATLDSQSAFFPYVGNSSFSSGQELDGSYFIQGSQAFQSALGGAVGTFSEVGISSAAAPTVPSTGTFWSRALFLDSGGLPTTVTVLSTEYLNITYRWKLYPPPADAAGSVVLNGVTYNWVSRAANVTNTTFWTNLTNTTNVPIFSTPSGYAYAYPSTLGAITGAPSGTSTAIPALTNSTYVSGSYTAVRVLNLAQTAVNITGGIGALALQSPNGGNFQISFDKAVPKDANSALALTFAMSWARKT